MNGLELRKGLIKVKFAEEGFLYEKLCSSYPGDIACCYTFLENGIIKVKLLIFK